MKVVRTAVAVVGTVATIASYIPGPHQPIAAIVAAAATVASAALAVLAKPRSNLTGSPTDFKIDTQAPLPYMVGRTYHAGYCIHRDTWGEDNQYQGFSVVWSAAGPIHELESFLADRVAVAFDAAGAALGSLADFMWLKTQLGEAPEAVAIPSPVAGFPGWGADCLLSGYFAGVWVVKFDKSGKKYSGGVPSPGVVAKATKVYDPRMDSTYPGGDGPCRPLQEDTYVFSENGPLQGLTWSLGRYQNGHRVIGCGIPIDRIEVDQFIDAANVADANGWKSGGVVYSSDAKWNNLKLMLQTAAAEPMQLGARLSCVNTSPKVSIHTLTEDDLAGSIEVTGTKRRQERKNTMVPRFRSEGHGWQVIPASPVSIPELVIQDRGRRRTEEYDIPLCQDKDQAAQLTAYRILNSREIGPIQGYFKLRWYGLRGGDCVTLHIPKAGLFNQKVTVLTRKLDVTTGSVFIVFETETDSKHPVALGQVGIVPDLPDLGGSDEPTDNSLLTEAELRQSIINSYTLGVTSVMTAEDEGNATATIIMPAHTRRYHDGNVAVDGAEILGLDFGETFLVYYDQESRAGGAVAYATTQIVDDAYPSDGHPYRHWVGTITTPLAAGPATFGTSGSNSP